MKSSLLLLVAWWSSLALALEGSSGAHEPGMPASLREGRTLMRNHLMARPGAAHSTLHGATSQAYDPWVEQATGLPSAAVPVWPHAVDSNIAWVLVYGEQHPAVILTTNGGTTWICDTIESIPTSLHPSGVFALDARRCWILMYDSSNATGGAIVRTTDGGISWSEDSLAFTTPGGFADFIHFFDGNNGVAVGDPTNGYFEIYTTSNGGNSWSRVPQANIPPKLNTEFGLIWNFSAAGSSCWFSTANAQTGPSTWLGTGRYYRSTDRGLTWSVHVYPGASPGYVPILGFQDDDVGLGTGGWGELSRTTDGGLTWTRIFSPSHFGFLWQIQYVPGTSGMYVGSAVWQYPDLESGAYSGSALLQYPDLEAGSFVGTVYTTDGGGSWTRTFPVNETFFFTFASGSAGWRTSMQNVYKWTIAQGRVISTSSDSLNFHPLEPGQMSDTVAIDAVNFGTDPLTVSGIVSPGNQFTVETRTTLPIIIPPLGYARVGLRFTPHGTGVFRDSIVFVSDASNAPRRIVNLQGTGAEFQSAHPWLPYGISASTDVLSLYEIDRTTGSATLNARYYPQPTSALAAVTVRRLDNMLYGAFSTGKSTDLYRLSSASGLLEFAGRIPIGLVTSMAFNAGDTLYLADASGRIYRTRGITADTVFIGQSGHLFTGLSFSPVAGELWGSAQDTICTIDPATGLATMVGHDIIGITRSSIAFSPIGTLYGLFDNTFAVVDRATGRTTAIGQTGVDGVLSIAMRSDPAPADVESAPTNPRVTELYQNYPNPFNPSTSINFQLSSVSFVTLKVYDILGREVAVLVNEQKAAGEYTSRFDASQIGSGVYFYRLEAQPAAGTHSPSFVRVRKMIVVK